MKIKLIKTVSEYDQALERIELLMDLDSMSQDQEDELEVLAFLAEAYEEDHFPIDLPDPVEAIKFRMSQEGLKRKDLEPYLGNKSRVSEVMNGKRPLSLTMMRRLHEGLGIPAEVLLQEKNASLPEPVSIEWSKFPINEMHKRAWFKFDGSTRQLRDHAEELMRKMAAGLEDNLLQPILNRQQLRASKDFCSYAMTAWRLKAISEATQTKLLEKYEEGSITDDFRRELAKLSYLDQGPLLAKEFLNKNGIHLIVLAHLPKTHLDGASMFLANCEPLIALTLRYDRLDNFWFTLFHELAHIALHFGGDKESYYFDDLESSTEDIIEKEADAWAAESLIPHEIWRTAGLDHGASKAQIQFFSREMRINPAIPAGRLRREFRDYRIYSDLLGNKMVKKLFTEQEG
ncbi:ImmA/IrrE family metallo-endopeptidase [Lentisphaera profundi]|uniref:ImmA/IrrE family metallo-endopeptidase n=1 Tax=Lentisphaera profundi TaxID=1658616 RepID=A0ABY7W0G9_9BACT|nr:ImmA/IrrE family metallo-endopeptidase [Lentisphaera profundi]WDE98531.1 ImmA/IrrE family metallo-endopeptidase [Lentisphaera profundi]